MKPNPNRQGPDGKAEERTRRGNALGPMEENKRPRRRPAPEETGGNRQQGGFTSGASRRDGAGRKPPEERDRDYDPDGDRLGRQGPPL